MSDQNKLEVRDLYMNFDGKTTLNHVNFEVHHGEFLSILGPSGCGKTTILRILIGLLKPTGGTVFMDGVDITNNHPSARKMGIVFQNYALFENMTVLGNVEYALKIRKENKSKQARQEVRNKALELLKQLGLSEHINKKAYELSGGQQQRVAIARTLITNPDIILFDEPELSLSIKWQMRFLPDIIDSKKCLKLITVTHSPFIFDNEYDELARSMSTYLTDRN